MENKMIPHRMLMDLGFEEVTKNLFLKELGRDIKLYLDYRGGSRSRYAYNKNKPISTSKFKEIRAVEYLERNYGLQECRHTLKAYT